MVQAGEPFPDLDLPTDRGPLKDLLGRKPLVLAFYRGSWCPICMGHLRALRDSHREFGERAEVVAVAVESPDSWQGLTQKMNLPFAMAADPGGEAARRLGVRIADGATLLERLDKRLHRREGYAQPALFVVDKRGVVRFRYVGRGPFGRPPARRILRVLRGLED